MSDSNHNPKKLGALLMILSALVGLTISILGIIQKNLTISFIGIVLGLAIMLIGIYISSNLLHKHSKQHLFTVREKILITTLFLFIVAFPISFAILHLGRDIAEGTPTLRIGSADGWLTLIGSVIGGAITMLALLFTINDSNETKRIISRFHHKPFHHQNKARRKIHHHRKNSNQK